MASAATPTVERAVLVEKRWDLATLGVATIVTAVGATAGAQISGALTTFGPLIGLAAIYLLRSLKARTVSAPLAVAARLELETNRAPWTWTMVFVLATWLTIEVAQALLGMGVGLAVGAYGGSPGDFALILTANAVWLLVIASVAAAAGALPAGYALGQRSGRRALLWVLVGTVVGRLAFLVSAFWAQGQLGSEVDPAGIAIVHGLLFIVVLGAGLLGAWRGAKRADAFSVAALYRALPPDTQRVAYDLLRDEARVFLASGSSVPQPAEVVSTPG